MQGRPLVAPVGIFEGASMRELALLMIFSGIFILMDGCSQGETTYTSDQPVAAESRTSPGKAPGVERPATPDEVPDAERTPRAEKRIPIVCSKCKIELRADQSIKCECSYVGKMEEFWFLCLCGNEVKYIDLTADARCTKCGAAFEQNRLRMRCPRCGWVIKLSDLKCDVCKKSENEP